MSEFETQGSLDALATRLVQLRNLPPSPKPEKPADSGWTAEQFARIRMREANGDLLALVRIIQAASPANKLNLTKFTPAVIADFAPEHRGPIQHMLIAREQAEHAATDITPANFSHWAYEYDRTAQLKDFIARGAPLDAPDPSGDTPLLVALRRGNVEAVRLLLAAGANPNARDREGLAGMHALARYGGVGDRAQQLAAARMLIAAKADVSPQDAEGRTPLHDAAAHKFPKMAQMLVDSGANVNAEASAQGLRGLRPLQVALDQGDLETGAILRAHGAHLNFLFASKRAALHGASMLLAPFMVGH